MPAKNRQVIKSAQKRVKAAEVRREETEKSSVYLQDSLLFTHSEADVFYSNKRTVTSWTLLFHSTPDVHLLQSTFTPHLYVTQHHNTTVTLTYSIGTWNHLISRPLENF